MPNLNIDIDMRRDQSRGKINAELYKNDSI